MEQTSYHGNKSGISSLLILLVLVSAVTFTSFRQAASQELALSQKRYCMNKNELEKTNQNEIAGISEVEQLLK